MVTEFFDVDQEISLISGDIIISFTFHLFTFHFSPWLSIPNFIHNDNLHGYRNFQIVSMSRSP